MKKQASKLRNLFTIYLGSGDKPIVQEWIGFRNGDDAYIGQNKYYRNRSKRVLRWSDGAKTFDTEAAAIASLKPVKGWALKWRDGIMPAFVIKAGDGKLRATDKDGHSKGQGFLTKKAAAKEALKEAVLVEKRKCTEYCQAQLAVRKLRKILVAR